MKIWDIFHPFGQTSENEFVVLSKVLHGKGKAGPFVSSLGYSRYGKGFLRAV